MTPRTKLSLSLLALVVIASQAIPLSSYPPCVDGVHCFQLSPPDLPGMTFDCAYVKAEGTEQGVVFHAHGNDGFQSKAMWFDVMKALAPEGFSSLACDLRGYSPGASPDEKSDYYYDVLARDIFSIMDASGISAPHGGKFHQVAHDHGASISMHAMAKNGSQSLGRQRFLSLTTLAIPHADVFADSIYGPRALPAEVESAQYVRMLVLPNATYVYGDRIWNIVCSASEHFSTHEQCQRTLWWYNGAIDAGAVPLAPMGPYGKSAAYVGIPKDVVENLTTYPLTGVEATVRLGHVDIPWFYGCGSADLSNLCGGRYENETRALVDQFTFYGSGRCGHNPMDPSCADKQHFIDAIIANIKAAYE